MINEQFMVKDNNQKRMFALGKNNLQFKCHFTQDATPLLLG